MVALLVVLTLALLLGVDLIVQAVEKRRHPAGGPVAHVPSLLPGLWHRVVPSGIFLDPGHTWAMLTPEGRLQVGPDQLVLGSIGRLDRVEAPPPGTWVRRGQPLLRLWRNGRMLVVTAPTTGAVSETNEAMLREPNLAFARLYQPDGWLVEISPQNLSEDLPLYKIAQDTATWLQREFARLRGMVADGVMSAVPVAADGGEPVEGFLAETDPAGWDCFNSTFLHSRPPVGATA